MRYRFGRRVVAAVMGLSAAAVVLSTLLISMTLAAGVEVALSLQSPSAILIEAHSGRVLYEKAADDKRAPASMTKVMTLLLIMEALDRGDITLDDTVVTSANAARMGGTQIWLAEGEEMNVDDLLKSIAIASANDAAVAMAEYVAGAEEVFVEMMNKRAQELGASNTTFVNPTGLPPDDGGIGNLTTSRDMALMANELVKHPKVLEYTSTWIDQVRGGTPVLNNTNRLVRYYDGCDGLKTGYIDASKHCLVCTAQRDGLRLISVVMGAETSNVRYDDTRKLLDYGFSTYKAVPIVKKGQVVGEATISRGEIETIPIVAASDFTVVVPKRETADFAQELIIDTRIRAPITKGDRLAELVVKRGDEVIASVHVVASQDVRKGSISKVFVRSVRNLLRSLFGAE